MGAGLKPAAFEDGLCGGGGRANDIGGFDGGFRGFGDVDGVSGGEAVSEGLGVAGVAAPKVDRMDFADEGNGFYVSFGLFASAQDGEGLGVFAGEQAGGDGAC